MVLGVVFDDDAIETASNRIDQYTQDVCGVDLGVDIGGGDPGGAVDEPPMPEVSDDASLIDQLFQALGLGAIPIPDDIKSCMDDQLVASGAFPDGISTGFIVDAGAFMALDDAANACGFDDF